MFNKSKNDPGSKKDQDAAPRNTTQKALIVTTQKNSRSGGATTPSIIGSDVSIEGNISTAGELQLDGVIVGDIACGSMIMGEHGSVNGSITAEQIIIRGKVDGEIRGRDVRLEKSAEVTGDVWHESLAIEAGARISGKFQHTDQFTDAGRSEKPIKSIGSSSSVAAAGSESAEPKVANG